MPLCASRYQGSSALNINLIVIFVLDLATLQNDNLALNGVEFIEAYDTLFLFINDFEGISGMLSLDGRPRHVRLPLSLQILDDLGLSVLPLSAHGPLMDVVLAVLDQVNYNRDQENIYDEQVVSYPYDQHQVAQVPPSQEEVVVICVSVSLLVPDPCSTVDLQSDVENVDGVS